MSTERLYYADPFLASFSATVVGHGEHAGRPTLQLDKSAFYPESGGQLGDRGAFGALPVVDVQVRDDGTVEHLVDGERPAIGTTLTGTIEWPRRRLHMALHTAQHLFSRALIDVADAETISARLGDAGCTVDLDRAAMKEADIEKAARLVNQVIEDDLVIRSYFPEPGELEKLKLRRAPKVDMNVRVIQVGEFDVSPCGGTHCARTAQVGLLSVTAVAKEKGKVRIHFDAGRRALDGLVAQSSTLGRLATRFTCGALEVERAVDRLGRDLDGMRLSGKKLGLLAAKTIATELMNKGERVAILDGDRELLRAVAAELTPQLTLPYFLAVKEDGGLSLLVGRGEGATADCGALFKQLAALAGGKGGGRPDRAEGKLPENTDLARMVREIEGY